MVLPLRFRPSMSGANSVNQNRPLPNRATIVLRKLDAAGGPPRQIELCDRHAEAVIARERARGLEILTGAIGAKRSASRPDREGTPTHWRFYVQPSAQTT